MIIPGEEDWAAVFKNPDASDCDKTATINAAARGLNAQ
jgi:hypothetical protein